MPSDMGLGRRRDGGGASLSSSSGTSDNRNQDVQGMKGTTDSRNSTLRDSGMVCGTDKKMMAVDPTSSFSGKSPPEPSTEKKTTLSQSELQTKMPQVVPPVAKRRKTLVFKRSFGSLEAATYAIRVGDELLVSENNHVTRISRETGRKLGPIPISDPSVAFENPTGLAQYKSSRRAEDMLLVGEQGGKGLKKIRLRDMKVVGVTGQVGVPGTGESAAIDSALGVAHGNGMVFVADVTAYRVTARKANFRQRRRRQGGGGGGGRGRRGGGKLIWTFSQDDIGPELKAKIRCETKAFDLRTGYDGPACFNPHDIAFSPSGGGGGGGGGGGRLFVADADNGMILVLDATNGSLVQTIRTVGGRPFKTPRGVSIVEAPAMSSPLLIVAELQRLLLLDLQGDLKSEIAVPGSEAMLGITNDDQADAVYVGDPGANKVHVFEWSEEGSDVNETTADDDDHGEDDA
eukprot:jgi/Bigna1/77888/fgenesh1_pg.51_\